MSSPSCDRRSFLAGAVLLPAATITAAPQRAGASADAGPCLSPAAAADPGQQPRELPKPATGVRITVLKRTQELALQKKYVQGGVIPACGLVRDGQEFVARPPYESLPDGMCKPAWDVTAGAAKFVHGGSVDRMVVCCTDGYRPVFFLFERITGE